MSFFFCFASHLGWIVHCYVGYIVAHFFFLTAVILLLSNYHLSDTSFVFFCLVYTLEMHIPSHRIPLIHDFCTPLHRSILVSPDINILPMAFSHHQNRTKTSELRETLPQPMTKIRMSRKLKYKGIYSSQPKAVILRIRK